MTSRRRLWHLSWPSSWNGRHLARTARPWAYPDGPRPFAIALNSERSLVCPIRLRVDAEHLQAVAGVGEPSVVLLVPVDTGGVALDESARSTRPARRIAAQQSRREARTRWPVAVLSDGSDSRTSREVDDPARRYQICVRHREAELKLPTATTAIDAHVLSVPPPLACPQETKKGEDIVARLSLAVHNYLADGRHSRLPTGATSNRRLGTGNVDHSTSRSRLAASMKICLRFATSSWPFPS